MDDSSPEPREVLEGGSAEEGSSSAARAELCPAAVQPRLWALFVDATTLGLAGIAGAFGVVLASLPFWEVSEDPARGRSLQALAATVPGWVSWVVLGVLAVLAVVLSGALSRPGRRRSFGLAFAELTLSRAGVDVDVAASDPAESWDAALVDPSRGRIAARWLLPLATFAVLAPLTGGLLAGLVTLGGWAPALVGSRRSVYDRLTGVAVVDPVRSIRRGQDAAKARRRALS